MRLLVALLQLALIALNLFGGVVAAVWLIVQGQWGVLLLGLGAILLGPVLLPILLIPVEWVAPTGDELHGHAPTLALMAKLGVATFMVASVMAWWMLAMPGMVMQWLDDPVTVPVLLWAYNVAIVPWVIVAQRQRTDASWTWAGYGTGVAILGAAVLLASHSVTAAAIALSAGMAVCWAANLVLAWHELREEHATGALISAVYANLERERHADPALQPDQTVGPEL